MVHSTRGLSERAMRVFLKEAVLVAVVFSIAACSSGSTSYKSLRAYQDYPSLADDR